MQKTGNVPQRALRVNDEQTTEGNTLLLDEDTVVTRNRHVAVREERKLEVRSETALLAGLSRPCEVGEVRVGRRAEDNGVDGLELRECVVEREDLGRADEREVSVSTDRRVSSLLFSSYRANNALTEGKRRGQPCISCSRVS